MPGSSQAAARSSLSSCTPIPAGPSIRPSTTAWRSRAIRARSPSSSRISLTSGTGICNKCRSIVTSVQACGRSSAEKPCHCCLCQRRRETRPKGGPKHCHRGRGVEVVRGGRASARGGVSRKRREGVARPEFPAEGGAVISLRGPFPARAVVEAVALAVHLNERRERPAQAEPVSTPAQFRITPACPREPTGPSHGLRGQAATEPVGQFYAAAPVHNPAVDTVFHGIL